MSDPFTRPASHVEEALCLALECLDLALDVVDVRLHVSGELVLGVPELSRHLRTEEG